MLPTLALLLVQEPVLLFPRNDEPALAEIAAELAQETSEQEHDEHFAPWHKNYFVVAYSEDLSRLPSPAVDGNNIDMETNFQLSVRSEIFEELILDGWHAFLGYTATSFWQTFNSGDSSPFRTTDHQPEIFGESEELIGRWRFRIAPYAHMSNGESGADSRSWNRFYGEAIWHSDPAAMQVKSFSISDLAEVKGVRVALKVWEDWGVDDDNNGDIADYFGHFEANLDWFMSDCARSAVSLMLRNNLQSGSDNRTTFRLEYSRNCGEKIRLLFQFHNGYGLNLLDYDRHLQYFGLGFEISP